MAGTGKRSLDIIIIGAGLGGLSAAICLAQKGHNVRVFEQNNTLSEYGAGIQVSPNAIRLLTRWGLREVFEDIAFAPQATACVRYCTGEVIGESQQNPLSEKTYGYPYWQVYRPDFQRVLFDGAEQNGVKVEFGRRVTSAEPDIGSITFADGRTETADLVICADGVNSRMRHLLVGQEYASPSVFTESNYRAMVPAAKMMMDPETASLMASNKSHAFLGPGLALIAYSISKGQLFNMAIISKATEQGENHQTSPGKWNEPTDMNQFRTSFSSFCPLVQKLISLVDHAAGWTISEVKSLPTWSSATGRMTLIGDAAHAMSPHAAQGAAMAIEDAAVLGECLELVSSQGIASALKQYESIRKPRVSRVAEIARNNGDIWVLPDGPEQERRDEKFRALSKTSVMQEKAQSGVDRVKGDPEAPWPSIELLTWIYGYDAVTSVRNDHLAI